jgi:hypothetical protein
VSILFVLGISLEGASALYLDKHPIPTRQNVLFGAANGRDNMFVLKPDKDGNYLEQGKGRDAFTDSAGNTFSIDKAPDCIRILCLGGSETYGVGADKNHSFPALLGYLLNAMYGGCGIRFEVINAGFMGYHSWHSRVLMLHGLAAFKPDAVLFLHGANDMMTAAIINDPKELQEEQENILRALNGDDDAGLSWLVRLVDSELNTTISSYRIARSVLHEYWGGKGAKELKQKLDMFDYRGNVRAITGIGARGNFETLLLNYPWIAKRGDAARNDRARFKGAPVEIYEQGREYFDSANRELSAEDGIRLVDLLTRFDGMVEQKGIGIIDKLYHDEVHFTKIGNYFVAEAIIEQLFKVRAISERLQSCGAPSEAGAKTLMHPMVFFSNGWPEPPSGLQPVEVSGEVNIARHDEGPPGWVVCEAADKSAPGVISVRYTARPQGQPMASNGVFNTFFYPRVASSADQVRAVSASGKALFSLAGLSGKPEWTGVSDKFGLNLPDGGPGDTITIELRGKAQLWRPKGGVFFTNDTKFPGY